jgi:amino acid permease
VESSPSGASYPMSPGKKLLHIATSPVRLVRRQVEAGSVNSSVFSLIIICMGAGTITIPYVFYENGLFLGTVFIFFGGSLSLYTGFLIAYCSEKTGGRSFEEIAFHLYGTKGMRFTCICNLLCNIGFLISYIVLVSHRYSFFNYNIFLQFKELTPYTIENFGVHNLPDFLGNTNQGKMVWATIFVFVCLLPISLPRELKKLRFTSFVSFGISIVVVLSIFSLSFKESKKDGINMNDFSDRAIFTITNSHITLNGVFNSLPLVIFSFMY